MALWKVGAIRTMHFVYGGKALLKAWQKNKTIGFSFLY